MTSTHSTSGSPVVGKVNRMARPSLQSRNFDECQVADCSAMKQRDTAPLDRPSAAMASRNRSKIAVTFGPVCQEVGRYQIWESRSTLQPLTRLRLTRTPHCYLVTVGSSPLKVSRRKRRLARRLRTRGQDAIEVRKAKLEAEVARGLRDARTLVSIPVDLARNSTVRFPRNAFGEPEPW